MNRDILARGALLLTLSMGVAACDEGLTEVNQDPNAPTDVPAQYLLPQAIRSGVENTFDSWMNLSHTSVWAHHDAEIQYPDEEEGQVRPGNMEAFWSSYYTGPLKDAQVVIDKGVEEARPNIEAVGLIWRAWVFHQVTDLYGDIPYSQALNGEENTQPAYDPQSQVYAGLLNDLERAAGLLTASGTGFGAGDLIYSNDFVRWERFANSLRMRLAMRMSEVDATTAASEFAAAYAAGPMQSNADNAVLAWPGAPYENPLYENWQGRDDHGISADMVNTLSALNDPRLQLYAEPTADASPCGGVTPCYHGHTNGIGDPPLSLAAYSRIGNFWRANGAATPTVIMSYSESKFLEAEAAARGWIAGSAAALYLEAIEANMEMYQAQGAANAPTDAEIAAYLAQPAVAYTGINDIHLQKWLSLYMQGPEAWANVRRTDQPVLAPGSAMLANLGQIPVRFYYPDSEQSLNSENLGNALTAQGMSAPNLTTNVWWDVN